MLRKVHDADIPSIGYANNYVSQTQGVRQVPHAGEENYYGSIASKALA